MFRTWHIRFVFSNFAADIHHAAAVRADDFSRAGFFQRGNLSVTIAPEISACLTENVPPKPQHSLSWS